MDKNERNAKDYYVIDLAHVVKVIWQRIWVIALVSLLTTAIGFSMAAFVIPPSYSASIMLYVGSTKTMTISIYTEVIRGNYGVASALSTILIASTVLVLMVFFKLTGRTEIEL